MSENSSGAALSDAEARYGPNWPDVLKVIHEARTLTHEQVERARMVIPSLDAMATVASDEARHAARIASWDADLEREFEAAWSAAWDAVLAAAPGEWYAAVAAAGAAKAAVVSGSLDRRHHNALTRPWRVVIGEGR